MLTRAENRLYIVLWDEISHKRIDWMKLYKGEISIYNYEALELI